MTIISLDYKNACFFLSLKIKLVKYLLIIIGLPQLYNMGIIIMILYKL